MPPAYEKAGDRSVGKLVFNWRDGGPGLLCEGLICSPAVTAANPASSARTRSAKSVCSALLTSCVSGRGLNNAFLCLYIPATAFSPLFLSGTSHSEPGTRGTRLIPITSNFPPSTSVASNNRRLSPLPRDGRIILHRITNRRSPL